LLLHANAGWTFAHPDDAWPDVLPHELDGCEYVGLNQTSWALGRVVVVATRAVTPSQALTDGGFEYLHPFIEANIGQGSPLVELLDDQDISLDKRPQIRRTQLPSMMWFPMIGEHKGWTPYVIPE
jgi:hypothetical protein